MDHVSRIDIFLAVVKHHSFAAAARDLGMTGPAVSKQVQALEDRLGVRLLNRTTRQVTLTDAGAMYSERARKALEDLHEAERKIQDMKDHGILRVNAPMAFGRKYLTAPVAAFARQYPDVQVDVTFDDRMVDVVADGYDVVVRIGALRDSSLIARQIANCPIYVCGAPEFWQRHGVPETPRDLSKYPALMSTHQGPKTEWRFRGPDGTEQNVHLQSVFSGNTADILVEACRQGVGMTALPIFAIAEDLHSGRLQRVLSEYVAMPERGIFAVFPQNRYLSTKTRLFVDMLTQMGKALPW